MITGAAVVGLGTMGPGIAATLVASGVDVAAFDLDAGARAAAADRVEAACDVLDTIAGVGDIPRGTVTVHDDLADAVAGAGLVIEAVPERVELKHRVFTELDRVTDPESILASNTSGTPISTLQRGLSHPARVVGMHWAVPAHVVPVVEVIGGELTTPAVVDAAVDLVRAIGLMPVRVRKDVPGFVENRVLYALLREALALLDDGVVDREDLDTCVRWGIAMKLSVLGPLELLDVAGLDQYQAVASYLNEQLTGSGQVSPAAAALVRGGHLGLKSGRGWYDYRGRDLAAMNERRDHIWTELRRCLDAAHAAVG